METVYFNFSEVVPGTDDFEDYLEARYPRGRTRHVFQPRPPDRDRPLR